MAPSKNKCLICCEALPQQNIKIQSESEHLTEHTSDNDDKILRWKLLSSESLFMLFGLPADDSIISIFAKENGKEFQKRGAWQNLCNQCLVDLSDIHYVFWQLHNLELKLINLQKIIFQRLRSRSRCKASTEETAIENEDIEKGVKKLINDIQSGSPNWPKGVYISRWKKALLNVDRILASHDDFLNEAVLSGNVKVEVDQDFCEDIELPLLAEEFTKEYNNLEGEDYHWDDNDKDNEEQLELSPKPKRKSQRQVKSSKKSSDFEEESPDNQEDISAEDEDDYLIDNFNPLDEEEDADADNDDPGSDSDYSEVLESPKKQRRKPSQGKPSKPRKINNYQTNSEGKYVCTVDPQICSRTYAIKKRLTIHILGFHKERKYICSEEGCPQKYLTEYKLNCHLKNDHGIKRTIINPIKMPNKSSGYLCVEDPDICSRTYDTQKLLNKHIRAFHEGRNYICTEEGCVQKFLTELKLSYHLKKCHGIELPTQVKPQRLIIDPNELPDKPVFRCTVDPSICNRIYPQLKFLNGHIKRFHKGRNFKCDQEGCVQKFLTQVKLSQHLKFDHKIGLKLIEEPEEPQKKEEKSNGVRDCDAPHVCEICGLTVPRKLMKSHMTSKHLGYGKFKCDLCGMDFKNGEEITKHENLHTLHAHTYPFTCVAPNCTKVLTNSGDLKIHVNKNHLLSGLKCEICGVMKPNQIMLERHLLIHQRKRNLICEECGEAYYSGRMLRLHIESSHLGKKVCCEICGKEFLRMSSLKRHRLSHQGERNFKCAVCPKAFFNTTQRKNHEKTHAGVKNFECDLCGKRFKQKNNLNQHLRTQGHKDKVGKQERQVEGDLECEDFKIE